VFLVVHGEKGGKRNRSVGVASGHKVIRPIIFVGSKGKKEGKGKEKRCVRHRGNEKRGGETGKPRLSSIISFKRGEREGRKGRRVVSVKCREGRGEEEDSPDPVHLRQLPWTGEK